MNEPTSTAQKIIHLGAYLFGVVLTAALAATTIGVAIGCVWGVATVTKNLIAGA